jgi:hypothetical protein
MNYDEAYAAGVRTAQQAIAEGVPRWMHGGNRPIGQFIDRDTGLPLAGLSGPTALAEPIGARIRGYNDTVLLAIKSGSVLTDFRPLLMSRLEALSALASSSLGTLSESNPRIDAADAGFCLKLRLPKPQAKRPMAWISYTRAGKQWPDFELFTSPVEVAVGKEGRVLVLKDGHVILARDLETTQVLNSYPL